jgi:hypothetical protein
VDLEQYQSHTAQHPASEIDKLSKNGIHIINSFALQELIIIDDWLLFLQHKADSNRLHPIITA